MDWPVELEDLLLYRGDSKVLELRFWSNDEHTIAVDLTELGNTWESKVRPTPDDAAWAALVVDDTDAATGIIRITIPEEAWSVIRGLNSGFDLQVSGGDLSPVTVVRGRIEIEKDFTY